VSALKHVVEPLEQPRSQNADALLRVLTQALLYERHRTMRRHDQERKQDARGPQSRMLTAIVVGLVLLGLVAAMLANQGRLFGAAADAGIVASEKRPRVIGDEFPFGLLGTIDAEAIPLPQ
jgi:hypothetical protein